MRAQTACEMAETAAHAKSIPRKTTKPGGVVDVKTLPKNRLPDNLLRTAFKRSNLLELFKLRIPKPRYNEIGILHAPTFSGLRVYSTEIPEDTETSLQSADELAWVDVDSGELHALLNLFSLSVTTAARRTALRNLLQEYKFAVEYDAPEVTDDCIVLPMELVDLVMPYWLDWLFDTYDALIMWGYAPMAFYRDENIVDGYDIPIPMLLSPDSVRVQVNNLGTGMRYMLNESAAAEVGEAYLLVAKMPAIGHGYYFEEFHERTVYLASCQTDLAKQLPDYIRYKRYVAYDIASVSVSTCPPIITQVPAQLLQQDRQRLEATRSKSGESVIVEVPASMGTDQGCLAAAETLNLMPKDRPKPRGPQRDMICANKVRLSSGEEIAQLLPTREFSRDALRHQIDAVVTRLSGYPEIGESIDTTALRKLTSSTTAARAPANPNENRSRIGRASDARNADGLSYDAYGRIHNSTSDGTTCISRLEEILTIGWNIVFAGQNIEFAQELLTLMNLYFKNRLTPPIVRRIRSMSTPRVHILLPKVVQNELITADMFDVMEETKALWTLAHGITPRAFQRMRTFLRVYPQMKPKKPEPDLPVTVSSATKSSTSSSSASKKSAKKD